jgi:hypothetical protein
MADFAVPIPAGNRGQHATGKWKKCQDVADEEKRDARDAALWAHKHRIPIESLTKEHQQHKQLLTSWWDEHITEHTKRVEMALRDMRVSIVPLRRMPARSLASTAWTDRFLSSSL